jgi:hypothetical protein
MEKEATTSRLQNYFMLISSNKKSFSKEIKTLFDIYLKVYNLENLVELACVFDMQIKEITDFSKNEKSVFSNLKKERIEKMVIDYITDEKVRELEIFLDIICDMKRSNEDLRSQKKKIKDFLGKHEEEMLGLMFNSYDSDDESPTFFEETGFKNMYESTLYEVWDGDENARALFEERKDDLESELFSSEHCLAGLLLCLQLLMVGNKELHDFYVDEIRSNYLLCSVSYANSIGEDDSDSGRPLKSKKVVLFLIKQKERLLQVAMERTSECFRI